MDKIFLLISNYQSLSDKLFSVLKVHKVCLPEPSVDVLGEELGPVATSEITETSGRPKELNPRASGDPLEVLVFRGGLETDEVHATLAAVVTRVEPVPLGAGQSWVRALEGEPVVVTSVLNGSGTADPILAKDSVGEAKLARALAGVAAAIAGEQLVLSGGLRRLRPVIGESSTAAEESSEKSSATASGRPEDVPQEVELPIGKAGVRCQHGKGQNNFTRKSHCDA